MVPFQKFVEYGLRRRRAGECAVRVCVWVVSVRWLAAHTKILLPFSTAQTERRGILDEGGCGCGWSVLESRLVLTLGDQVKSQAGWNEVGCRVWGGRSLGVMAAAAVHWRLAVLDCVWSSSSYAGSVGGGWVSLDVWVNRRGPEKRKPTHLRRTHAWHNLQPTITTPPSLTPMSSCWQIMPSDARHT